MTDTPRPDQTLEEIAEQIHDHWTRDLPLTDELAEDILAALSSVQATREAITRVPRYNCDCLPNDDRTGEMATDDAAKTDHAVHCEREVVLYADLLAAIESGTREAAPPLYKGHIDPDCEVYRGVGGFCTCETPEEKAERARERAEIEAEQDAVAERTREEQGDCPDCLARRPSRRLEHREGCSMMDWVAPREAVRNEGEQV